MSDIRLNDISEKSRLVSKALAKGLSYEQLLAADRTLTSHDVSRALSEGDAEPQPARACRAEHALALDRGSRQFDAGDANIKEAASAGQVGEELPNNVDRRLDDVDRTSRETRGRLPTSQMPGVSPA